MAASFMDRRSSRCLQESCRKIGCVDADMSSQGPCPKHSTEASLRSSFGKPTCPALSMTDHYACWSGVHSKLRNLKPRRAFPRPSRFNPKSTPTEFLSERDIRNRLQCFVKAPCFIGFVQFPHCRLTCGVFYAARFNKLAHRVVIVAIAPGCNF